MADWISNDVLEALDGRIGVEQLLAELPEWVVLVDRTYTIQFVSKRPDAVEHPGNAFGMNLRSFVDPARADEYIGIVEQVFAGGERVTFEAEATNIDGTPGWYVITVSPVRKADGSIPLVVMMTRDISERRIAEQAVERALEQERAAVARLEELDELKSDFVAKVVHDLRTPITVIQGFADTLEQRWEHLDDSERRRFVNYMGASTKRLMLLVQDIMLVSRLESGELPIRRERFDLRAMTDEVVDELAASRGDDPVRIVGSDRITAFGDEQRIRQVLVNLLDNALRYSPTGEQVVVELENQPTEQRVTVVDHGPGVAKADRGRLFQRFSQLGDESAHDGSGLGLYICRSIIEAHGGAISVEDAPDHGASFTFTLPVDE
jgi:PAS domain S-box-containing protein